MNAAYHTIIAKLRPSIVETPEAKLMFAIWSQALADVMTRPLRPLTTEVSDAAKKIYNIRATQIADAMEFLTNSPYVLNAAGIESEYAWRIVHEVCESYGIILTTPKVLDV
jgi:hypothetical protein